MKKFGTLLLVAVMGSVLTMASYKLLIEENQNKIEVHHVDAAPAQSAVYALDDKGQPIPLDFTTIAAEAMDAVVHIKSTQTVNSSPRSQYQQGVPDIFREFFGPYYRGAPEGRKPEVRVGAGSGVIIESDGYIITNHHVIADADDIEVTLHDKRTYKAELIGQDPSTDLAVLKIEETDLTKVGFNNSDQVRVGEWVLAVGNPFNLNSTVTAGIVSAKARNINILRDKSAIESFIQTDAAINPGNSGGALVNLQGQLIGINTAIASPTGSYAGYGFAVPANLVNKVYRDLKEYGIVQRGYLGVYIKNVDGNLAKELELDVTEGVYIEDLLENSAAQDAGVKKGDVVLKVEDKEVNNVAELQENIARHRPGEKVSLLIHRDGKLKELDVVLHNKQGTTKVVSKKERDILEVLGIQLKEVDGKMARKLEIDGGVQIMELRKGILTKNTQVAEGFIITKINHQPVSTVDEVVEILSEQKQGVLLEGVYENYPGVKYYGFGMK